MSSEPNDRWLRMEISEAILDIARDTENIPNTDLQSLAEATAVRIIERCRAYFA
ncbi:MAG: hypothetical protein J0H43_14235 [Actinobacteria bacterium]|nr:hypothetical protein [Actinomycetota bacterium]